MNIYSFKNVYFLRYFIKLCYNGNAYHGWQMQQNTTLTIQHVLNGALSKILNEPVATVGCGRTDGGVHALEFYAHFNTSSDLIANKEKFIYKINAILPADIAIQDVMRVKEHANARFDAISRTYEYHIHQIKSPFKEGRSYFFHYKLNIDKMNEASQLLTTHKDFTSFSKKNTQTFTNNCHIMHAFWETKGMHDLVFTIKADRFLRNMVRAIVGTLLNVGKEKLSIQDFKNIIDLKNRSAAGLSVPACGLYLINVTYPPQYFEL